MNGWGLYMHHSSDMFEVKVSMWFIPPLNNIADQAGYIVFKDSKVVLFYSNDLCEIQKNPSFRD
jgi:hypothetical protein